VTVAPKTGFIV